MSMTNWMNLFQEIEQLESAVTRDRHLWMEKGIGSGFSYYLYLDRRMRYREKWNALLELAEKGEAAVWELTIQFRELAEVCLKDVGKQAMINRDDFPKDAKVTLQAEKIIQEANRLLDYCNKI